MSYARRDIGKDFVSRGGEGDKRTLVSSWEEVLGVERKLIVLWQVTVQRTGTKKVNK